MSAPSGHPGGESGRFALSCMEAQVLAVTKGEVILAQGDPFSGAYYVLEGVPRGVPQRAFDEITLAQFLPGGACAGRALQHSPESRSKVQLAAVSDSVLLRLCLTPLLARSCSTCGVPFRHQVLANLVQALSRQNIYLNQKVRSSGRRAQRTGFCSISDPAPPLRRLPHASPLPDGARSQPRPQPKRHVPLPSPRMEQSGSDRRRTEERSGCCAGKHGKSPLAQRFPGSARSAEPGISHLV